MNLKQNNGFALSDAIIAVIILMIFTGLVISISYNIYIQSNFIKRNDQATSYIVEIFEYAQKILYEDVTGENLVTYINDKKEEKVRALAGTYSENAEKQAPYTIFISVTDIHENFIKQVDVTVMYKLGTRIKTVTMSTLVNK